MSTTYIPVFSQDGQLGYVPANRVQDAVSAGFRVGHEMDAPDGSRGVVPHDRLHDAIRAGFTPHIATEAEAAANPPIAGPQRGSSAPEMLAAGVSLGRPDEMMRQALAPKLVRGVTGALPAVGGVGGALLASPTVAGAAGAAALGTGMGVEAKQLLNRAFFGESEPSPVSKEGLKELAISAGTAGATAGAMQGLVNLATKVPMPNYDWQDLNRAVGATQKSIRLGKGAESLEDAATMPGRGLANAGFDADTLKDMTPVDRMAAIAPHWRAAGKAVDLAVTDATEAGTTVDVGNSAFDVLKNIKNPAVQDKMIDEFNDLSREVGIADQRAATPTEARMLRQALAPSANFSQGARYGTLGAVRTQLYGSVSSDLHDAVPGLAELDQHYSDMRSAMDAAQRGAIKYAITPQEAAPTFVGRAVKKVLPYAAGATGAGGAYRLYQGVKDFLTNP